MNRETITSHDGSTHRKSARAALKSLAWILVGVVLTIAVVVDPLDIHPLDRWVASLLGRPGDEASMKGGGEREILFYRNPMDPTITSPVPKKDEMGMDYVPVYADAAAGTSGKSDGEREILFYRNPMDPTITSPVPKKDDMGMDYVPVYADEAGASGGGAPVVEIDPEIVQNMNVQVAPVERRDVTHHIRTVGTLEYDQQRMVSITTKYSGWIEKVYVNYVGEVVAKQQPLFDIYSPELVQTEQELLSALEYARKFEGASEDVRRRAEDLVSAARTRLGYWDITPQQIESLEKQGKVVRTLTVVAPAGGVVMMRMPGLEGMAVKPGMELFHIAGLNTLLVSVELFESQLDFVDIGSSAEISLSYFPGERFAGRVRFIEPEVAEKTRTVPVLVEVPNPTGKLRPGMFATVVFEPVVEPDALVVPRLAVIRTGERNVVILRRGAGRFAPREVRLGHEGEDYVEVLEGLQEGEEIVTSGQFLIDSEARLQEAIQKLMQQRAGASSAGAASGGPDAQ